MEPIRIMVLGMSGAGKTVYLASLYQKLSVQREGYALTTDASISARLNKAYNRVRDPALEWPSGTRSVDYVDVPFDCVINNPHGKFTAMKLLYLDYAGGILAADIVDLRKTVAGLEGASKKRELQVEQGLSNQPHRADRMESSGRVTEQKKR